MAKLRTPCVCAFALILGDGPAGLIERLAFTSGCPNDRARSERRGDWRARAGLTGEARRRAATVVRCWRPMVLAGVMVWLLAVPSTALASSGWSAPSAVDPAFPATSVSCPSTTFCAAVASDGHAMKAITFNGSSWSSPATIYSDHATCAPASACADSSVSCVSASFCVAVDAYGNTVTFNGSSWSAPITIPGTSTNQLKHVSCASPSFCVDVGGMFSPSSGSSGYAATFNGASWGAPVKIADGSWLESVSCPSVSFCMAVDDRGEALTFNGSSWGAPVTIDGSIALQSVSCASESSCSAVDRNGNALTFDGSSWTTQHIDGNNVLNAVSCPSVSFCVAVDADGWVFSSAPPVNIDDTNSLVSVSCASASFCVAVDHDGRFFAFNGSSWAAAVAFGGEDSVSCASASFCVAVDGVGRSLTFNGRAWSAPTTIDATSGLSSVSCPSTSFCATVDLDGRVLTFNGSSWSAPVSIDNAYPLVSVSCTSASFCAAVDSGTGAFIFNGSSWNSASPYSGLRSVSCASPSFCVAVSDYGRAVTYNGGSWTTPLLIDGTFNPATGVITYNPLTSVSCASPSFCAAGDRSGNVLTLAGTSWSPTGHAGLVTAVSCPSPSFCAAVDYGGNAVTFNGSAWSALANIDGTSQLHSVSCPSTSFCVAMDDDGQALVYTSSAPSAPSPTGPPTISGTPMQGQTLTESHGSWTHTPTSYSYQWEACDSSGNNCRAIASATGQSYLLTGGDVGHTIRVQESATNAGGTGGPASSAASAVIQPPAGIHPPPAVIPSSIAPTKPQNTSPPAIAGTPTVGHTLSASTGSWSGSQPIAYAYQWQRCHPGCVNIRGATSSTHKLTAADLGNKLRVLVSARNSAGSAGAASREVGPVAPSAPQIRRALVHTLKPNGKAARITLLLKHGGYTISFTAPSAGRLVIGWYYIPKGAHLTSATHGKRKPKPKPVRVAKLNTVLHHAGKTKIKLKLTGDGRALLKHSKRLKLTVKSTFAPTGRRATSAKKNFTLKR